MVLGLERRQVEGDVHFVTFSCYHRLAYLDSPLLRDLFEDALQKVHCRYRFDVIGYVVMPEHVHLLLSEPGKDLLAGRSAGVEALGGAKEPCERTFWQARYYDFNVFTEAKRIEKLSLYALESCETRVSGKAGRLALVELPLLPDRPRGTSDDRLFLETKFNGSASLTVENLDGCPTFAQAYVGRI